eukprot:9079779-Pyramimonas_sp.AAC.1
MAPRAMDEPLRAAPLPPRAAQTASMFAQPNAERVASPLRCFGAFGSMAARAPPVIGANAWRCIALIQRT